MPFVSQQSKLHALHVFHLKFMMEKKLLQFVFFSGRRDGATTDTSARLITGDMILDVTEKASPERMIEWTISMTLKVPLRALRNLMSKKKEITIFFSCKKKLRQ